MADAYNLQRFLTAQAPTYDTVLAELRAGRKSSHWIWFIFPQITGLGRSGMAQQLAICSLDEAKAYLQHPVRARNIHEDFYCNRRYDKPNGVRARRSVSQHTVSSMLPSFAAPRARLAWRLGGFVTNSRK